MNGIFLSSFWETDFVTQTGFETLNTHMKEGQKSCKWLEDFFKQRIKAEEEYAKNLLKIARTTGSDFGTLNSSIEKLLKESEAEAALHLSLKTKLQDQCTKLTEFRESQREDRKRNEEIVHRVHKIKAEQYKRMHGCKTQYEQRYKAAEKADSDAEKVKFGTKPKETEKAKAKAIQCRSSCLKADDEYKASVESLEIARTNWERDHSACCNIFQRMEEERIQMMRNQIWIFTNFISDYCCSLDESRESIRKVAELCSEEEDILSFAKQKMTCKTPLQKISYQSCDINGYSNNSSPNNRKALPTHSLPPIPNGSTFIDSNAIYEMGEDLDEIFLAVHPYFSDRNDELDFEEGDKIQRVSYVDHSWMEGLHLTTLKTGLVPINYLKKIS